MIGPNLEIIEIPRGQMIPMIRNRAVTGRVLFVAVFSSMLLAPWVHAAEKPKGPAASATKGQTYYTQFSLFHEGHTHRTTNYRKGILVPVNTEVVFTKATKKEIIVKLADGSNLTVANIEDFSGEKIDGIFIRTFSTNKVELAKFTDVERNAILGGFVETGMSKGAVLVALGYPPKHQTSSLLANQWRYWQNRFNTFVVHFKDDRVSQIQD